MSKEEGTGKLTIETAKQNLLKHLSFGGERFCDAANAYSTLIFLENGVKGSEPTTAEAQEVEQTNENLACVDQGEVDLNGSVGKTILSICAHETKTQSLAYYGENRPQSSHGSCEVKTLIHFTDGTYLKA